TPTDTQPPGIHPEPRRSAQLTWPTGGCQACLETWGGSESTRRRSRSPLYGLRCGLVGRAVVSELAHCSVSPAVGIPNCGDAAGVPPSGDDDGELEVTGHKLGCGIVDRAAVSELPRPPVPPALAVCRGGDRSAAGDTDS